MPFLVENGVSINRNGPAAALVPVLPAVPIVVMLTEAVEEEEMEEEFLFVSGLAGRIHAAAVRAPHHV